MDNKEYVRLVELIISKTDIEEDEKLTYLQIIDIVRRIKKEDLKHYEDSAYTIKGKKLSDEDRITYEINRIHKSVEEDFMIGREDSETLISNLKTIAYRNAQPKKSQQEKQAIKEKLTRIQISQRLCPRFYTVFEDVVRQFEEEANKENQIQELGTFSK